MSAMKELYLEILEQIVRTQAQPGAKIIVRGYEHIVSSDDIVAAERLFENHN